MPFKQLPLVFTFTPVGCGALQRYADITLDTMTLNTTQGFAVLVTDAPSTICPLLISDTSSIMWIAVPLFMFYCICTRVGLL